MEEAKLPRHWRRDDGEEARTMRVGEVECGTSERYERADGAVVLNGWRSHHDPSNPSAETRLYLAFTPCADEYLYAHRTSTRLRVPRRWKSAIAAMRALDREWPFGAPPEK